MNEQFNQYLIIIILIIIFIAAIPVILLIRSKKHRKAAAVDSVSGGNVSVFFDGSGNVVMIPYVKDRYGSGRATANVEYLRAPLRAKRLGGLLRQTMKGCMNSEPCDTRQLIEILGVKDWNSFTEGRRNVSVHYRDGQGIVFNPTRNNGNGVFEIGGRRQARIIKAEADDEVLGSVLLDMLRYCR